MLYGKCIARIRASLSQLKRSSSRQVPSKRIDKFVFGFGTPDSVRDTLRLDKAWPMREAVPFKASVVAWDMRRILDLVFGLLLELPLAEERHAQQHRALMPEVL